MNSQKIVYYIALSLLLALSVSCSSNKKEQTDVEVAKPTMFTSSQDTIELRTKTIDYLNFVRGQDFDQAMNMLSSYDSESNSITSLSEEQRQGLLSIYNMYPIVEYTIDEINFKTETDSEIRYTIKMFDSDDENVPNRMKFQLSPKRIDGKWYICIDNRFKTE